MFSDYSAYASSLGYNSIRHGLFTAKLEKGIGSELEARFQK